jgi:sphingolipid 8-(E)-desaturase
MVKEYREIFKKVEAEGYYETDWLYYGWKFTYPFIFFFVALFLLKSGRTDYLTVFLAAVGIGLFQHQSAFLGHDSGHQGISHNWTLDYLICQVYGTMIFGVSSLWWKYTHNQHHVVVNEYDIDPDITHLPFFAVNKVL